MSSDLYQCSIFKQNMSLLMETSKDDSREKAEGTVAYLTHDRRSVINFDRVKTQFMNSLGISEEAANSVDALFQDCDYNLYFIEFKNGEVISDNIIKKAKDSVLILSDIVQWDLRTIREKSVFWLVISNDKFDRLSPQQRIAVHKAKRGEMDFSLYGLGKLRGYCFKNVNMLSASQFEKAISKI